MATFRVKKILVPIDFSLASRHALVHAEHIARLMHARITLLYVVEPFLDSLGLEGGTVAAAARILNEAQERGTQRLQELASGASERTGSKIHALTAIGPVAATIGQQAAAHECELIVMGTHGEGGFSRNMVGGNAYRVSTLSRTPLLTVHRPLRLSGYQRIVYPVRDSVRATDKFVHALTFARAFGAHVHLVGIPRPGIPSAVEKVRTICRTLQDRFLKSGISTDMTVILDAHPAEAVITFMHSRPGALVVINQDRDIRLVDLFQNTFPKKIMHNVAWPVLTIPKG